MWNLILIASYQKFAFLLPERYFFNDLNFPVFENCYSFYFFLFSYFVTIVCSQSAKKSVIHFYLQQIARFLQCFGGLMVFPLVYIKQIR